MQLQKLINVPESQILKHHITKTEILFKKLIHKPTCIACVSWTRPWGSLFSGDYTFMGSSRGKLFSLRLPWHIFWVTHWHVTSSWLQGMDVVLWKSAHCIPNPSVWHPSKYVCQVLALPLSSHVILHFMHF